MRLLVLFGNTYKVFAASSCVAALPVSATLISGTAALPPPPPAAIAAKRVLGCPVAGLPMRLKILLTLSLTHLTIANSVPVSADL